MYSIAYDAIIKDNEGRTTRLIFNAVPFKESTRQLNEITIKV